MNKRMTPDAGRRSALDEARSFRPPRGAYDDDQGYGEAVDPRPAAPPRVFGVGETGADYSGAPRAFGPASRGYWDGYDFEAAEAAYAFERRRAQEDFFRRQPHYDRPGDAYARPGRYNGDRGFWDRMSDEAASWFGDPYARERREADHRGRGPKGYRRSDERIGEDVHDRLTEDRDLDASGIEVEVREGEVTLNGVVSDRHDKHRAEHIVEHILGVGHVQNNLRVGPVSALPENTILADQAAGRS